MTCGSPVGAYSYDFRIIENYETGQFELQKHKFWHWKTIKISDSVDELEKQAKFFRKGYQIIKEFD